MDLRFGGMGHTVVDLCFSDCLDGNVGGNVGNVPHLVLTPWQTLPWQCPGQGGIMTGDG